MRFLLAGMWYSMKKYLPHKLGQSKEITSLSNGRDLDDLCLHDWSVPEDAKGEVPNVEPDEETALPTSPRQEASLQSMGCTWVIRCQHKLANHSSWAIS